ncbi:aspartyl-phosphate phosphatase Spo0E family protein [Calorimonas adulescens]|jgi:Spo0E like sporulation regulatory protein.|uniref:Aspartyl-phosphate phosphatase Spo0E family protein n=1 Tax=Calorimonas adulescens TaxID=2606906 RepID=A0A5D8QCJ8_9THEO|nr:aspartyl-phosphate phosphatase Spo0E family protein [Calorimonas adulescens]TZE81824.1 aspartyl-phosphate phosphatase Spo0E family protein [Calorimonas adulescens]
MEALSLEREIDSLRDELYCMIDEKEERKSERVLECSKKLDYLIVRYHKVFSQRISEGE